MFYCKTNLPFSSSMDVLYVDGTFKSAPKFSHQLFTIHGPTMCNWNFSYRLKNIQRPVRMYSDIRYQGLQKFGLNVFPTIVDADLETAIHNAVTTVWPGCEVKACRFHLGQSWWRKMQYLRLSNSMERKNLR